ncbi:ribosome biogenesis protein Utp30p [Diutina catenulata]
MDVKSPITANGPKSLKALKKQFKNAPETVYLNVTCEKPLAQKKDLTPRIIPLPHRIGKLEEKSILLVTMDPSTPYTFLANDDQPTTDVFNAIWALRRLRREAGDPKKRTKMYKEYDIVVADYRIQPQLPGILGSRFSKKVPFKVQMARPTAAIQLDSRGRKVDKPDERCEPKYVKHQVKMIAENSFFIPPAGGTCLSIRIGDLSMPSAHLVANAEAVVAYITEKEFRPVGGCVRPERIVSMDVKTAESMSLPVYKRAKEESDSEDEL